MKNMADHPDIAETPALPFLTDTMAGVEGGIIKFRFEDFVVEEIPLYPAGGEGDHTYLFIEKQGMATMDALNQIARAINYPRKQIGYAGLKDARAVTRQWISLEHLAPEKLESLSLPGLKVLQVARHSNKLRIGHLAGNRFILRLRKITTPLKEAHSRAEQIMEVLARRGVPNYFGPQRFGNRCDGQLLGEYVVKGDYEQFIDQMLGRPSDVDSSTILVARQYYEMGDYEKSLAAWPARFHDHHRAIKALITSGGDKKRAYNAVDQHMKRFFISAYQSDLFNQVLAARMPYVDKLLLGDMAMKHENGACFRVEDADLEQPRCDRFEISPTGPLYGFRMMEVVGPAGDIENPILATTGLTKRDFRQMGYYKVRGGRRPLRFQPLNHAVSHGCDDAGPYLEIRFELDSGCYATTVLREIMKKDVS